MKRARARTAWIAGIAGALSGAIAAGFGLRRLLRGRGGDERRNGADRRSGMERRVTSGEGPDGIERRSGSDRRSGRDRRDSENGLTPR